MSDPLAETTVLAAFAVGFISFLSPCVLPLVPGYLSAISGSSLQEIKERSSARKVLIASGLFCLTFSTVFILLGMTATGLGGLLDQNRQLLNRISGVTITLLGLYLLAIPFTNRLSAQWHIDGLISRAATGGPLIAGAAFALAWTPCIGPTLASILAAAATEQTVYKGGLLLACYSAGLAIPFMLSAAAYTRAMGAFRWLRDHYLIINAISGAILIAVGVLILTDQLTQLNVEAQRLLDRIGIDLTY